MVSRRFLLATVLAAFVSSPASGRRLPVRVFTVADGLPQNEINCVLEDSRGFLWIGTTDGLTRFDGRDFVTYGVAEGLPHPSVNHILETPDGSLWLATGAGVARFAVTEPRGGPSAFRTYRLVSEYGQNVVYRLYRDRKGRIWAGGSHGVFVLDPGVDSFRIVQVHLRKPPVPFLNACAFSESPEGDLWIGTTWGLVRILPDGRQVGYLPSEPDRGRGVRDVHLDSTGKLWICWDRGVTIYRPTSPGKEDVEVLLPPYRARCVELPGFSPGAGEPCDIPDPDPVPDYISEISESRSGEMRLLGLRHLFQPVTGALRRDEATAGLPDTTLTTFAEDSHGNFWIGTQTDGLVRIAHSSLSTYGLEDGLLREEANSVFEDSSGALCVTTTGGALHCFNGDRFVGVMPRLPLGLTYRGWGWNQIAFQSRNGEWWYATGQGVARYPATRRIQDLGRILPKKIYTRADGLPGNNIFRIFEDSRGDIWIATIGPGEEGIARWERATERIRVETERSDLVPGSAFGEDREGNLWIGSYTGGLARFRAGHWETLIPESRESRGLISQIFRDSRDRMWIATRVAGIIRVDDPASPHPVFRTYGRAQGLASDRTNAIAEDGLGDLYIATYRGIDRLDPATGRVRHYSAAEGLASMKTISASRDRSGRLWFAASKGLFCFDGRPDSPAPAPRVFLRTIEVGGKELPVPAAGTRTLRLSDLSPSRNQLRIGFVSPSLAPEEHARYRFALQDGAWSPLSSDTSVQYAGLPAGRYAFRVEAVSSTGLRSREPAVLEFRIPPPVWERGWFLAAAVLAVAGLLAWLHRQRVAGLLEVERVRSRIAADLHDDLGTSLYRISILSELAGRQLSDPGKNPKPLLSDIGQTARDLIESAGDMVWSVDPRHDNLGNLTARIRRYASEMLEARGVAGSLESPEEAEGIPIEANTRRELYLIFKEAIRNALRHGQPSQVALSLALHDGRLVAEIRDDGLGLPENVAAEEADDPEGYGLTTMRRRAESLGGDFQVSSRPGEGTRIFVELPFRGRA